MKDYNYNFEIATNLKMFESAFDQTVVKRFQIGDNEPDARSNIKVNYVYGPKQRILEDLVGQADHIKLPIVAITTQGFGRDESRLKNKIDDIIYRNEDGSLVNLKAIPFNIDVQMTILAKYQTDLEQIIQNFIVHTNPYIVYSWKEPRTGREIRTEVFWDGKLPIEYPTVGGNLEHNIPYRVTGTASFTIKTWIFKTEITPVKPICFIYDDIIVTKDFYCDYETLTSTLSANQKDSYVIEGKPNIRYVSPYYVRSNEERKIRLQGTGFAGIESIYVSGSDVDMYPLTQYEPTTAQDPFYGYMVPSFSAISFNELQFILPAPSANGFIDVIAVNSCGYGQLTVDADRSDRVENPYPVGHANYDAWSVLQFPYLNGIIVSANYSDVYSLDMSQSVVVVDETGEVIGLSSCNPLKVTYLPHTHTTSQITDFNEGVIDILNNYDFSADVTELYNLLSGVSACWTSACDLVSIVNTNSSNWNDNYSFTNTNSSNWEYAFNVATVYSQNSASQDYVNNNFVHISGDIMIGGLSSPSLSTDTLYVGSTTIIFMSSGSIIETLNAQNVTDFKSNYSLVNSNSAYWNNHIDTGVRELTGDWQSAHTTLNSNSSNWESNYSLVNSNSSNWNNHIDIDVRALTSNWESNYSLVNSNSSNWEYAYEVSTVYSQNSASQDYVNNNFVHISGDTMTGNLNLGNNDLLGIRLLSATEIHAISSYTQYQDITIYELSGFGVTGNVDVSGNVNITGNVSSTTSEVLSSYHFVIGKHDRPVETIHVREIHFENITTSPVWEEGMLYYDINDNALSFYSDVPDVSLQLGQEMWVKAVNKTGSIIPNGTVVYIDGVQGQRPTITQAIATSSMSASILGMTTHDVDINQNGYVTVFGLVRDLNTSSYNEGDIVYLSDTTPGSLTTTIPTPPNKRIKVGVVTTSHLNHGAILVHIEPDTKLNNNSDVRISNISDNDILVYSSISSVWTNVQSGVNIKSVYSTVNSNSSYWNNHIDTGVRALTSDWNSNYTVTNSNSSNWNSNYTTVNSNSSNWSNPPTSYLPLSGGQMTGNIIFNQSIGLQNIGSISNSYNSGYIEIYTNNTLLTLDEYTSAIDIWSNKPSTISTDDVDSNGYVVEFQNNNSGIPSSSQLKITNSLLSSWYLGMNENGSDIFSFNKGPLTLSPIRSILELHSDGNVYVQNRIYDFDSNSLLWGLASTNVINNSANWNSNYTTVNSNSSNWNTIDNSFVRLSGDTMTGNLNILKNSNNASISLKSDPVGPYRTTLNSATVTGSIISHTFSNNIGDWYYGLNNDRFIINFGNVGSVLSNNLEVTNGGEVYAYAFYPVNASDSYSSYEWDSNYSFTNANSANWNSNYTTVNTNSSNWNNHIDTDVRVLTSNWESTYSTVHTNSAVWGVGSGGGDTEVNNFVYTNSANILEVDSVVNANSATWSILDNSFVRLSGDFMSGMLYTPELSTIDIYVNNISSKAGVLISEVYQSSANTAFTLINQSDYSGYPDGGFKFLSLQNLWNGIRNELMYFKATDATTWVWGGGFVIAPYAIASYAGGGGGVTVRYSYLDFNQAGNAWYDMTKLYDNYGLRFKVATDNTRITYGPAYFFNTESVTLTTGSLAIFLNNSDERFSVLYDGSLSSRSIIYDIHGNSDQWNSNYTTVNSNSSNWNNHIDVRSLTSNWESTYITVNSNSASWIGGGSGDPEVNNFVYTNSANIIFNDGNSFGGPMTIGTNDSYNLIFETNNISRVYLNTNGFFGIGNDNPTELLTVSGNGLFDGTIYCDNIDLLNPVISTLPSVTASGDFLVLNINGSFRAIRLWDF